MNKDLQHLKILSIFHYIVGGLLILYAFFLLIYAVFVGMVFASVPPPTGGVGGGPPPALGWFLVLVFGGLSLLDWIWAICLLVAGWHLSRCKHYTYCLVMACTAGLFVPFGTILCVFTIIVLLRPTVKRLFETGVYPDDPDEADHSGDHLRRESYNIRR